MDKNTLKQSEAERRLRNNVAFGHIKKYLPLFIAAAVALIVAIYYFASGHNSFDNNVQQLEKSPTVGKVQTSSSNTVIVTCKNGESYEIVFKPGQTNYQDLLYNKCGGAGEIAATQQSD